MAVEYLDSGKRRSVEPILNISREFYGKTDEPCLVMNYEMQDWFYGSGIVPDNHPARKKMTVLDRDLPLSRCGFCASGNVLVIALQGCVHPISGDAYYDYEIVCRDCGKFTVFSYAEN